MSVDMLYPDNRNRGRRVDQLCTQIGDIQSNVKLNYNGGKSQEQTVMKKVDVILSQHDVKSIAELKKKLEKSLPADVREKYQKMVQRYNDDDSDLQTTMDIIGCVTMVAGGVAGGAKMIEFIACGDLAAATARVVRALSILGEDSAKAMRLLKMAAMALKELTGGVELGEVAAKALKFAKLAGTVLTAVGVILDGILLIVAAIEGAEQRTQLQNAIHDLVHRRLSAETVNIMSNAYSQYVSNIYRTCVSIKNHPKDEKRVADDIDEMVSDLKDELAKITFDNVWKRLEDRDKDAGNSWTTEDPSKATVKEWWDKEDDPKKYKGGVVSSQK
ncbi:hypothetical protein HFD88_002431 [Aspergillus terreus]|nr:hypothetical protein HFD88_002431 [Aspergillus terreus]